MRRTARLLLAMVALQVAGATSAEQNHDAAIQDMIDQSKKIIDQVSSKAPVDPASSTPRQRAVSQAIAAAASAQTLPTPQMSTLSPDDDQPSVVASPDGMVVYLMTTFPNLPETLETFGAQIQAYARSNPGSLAEVHVVVRGLLPGTRHLGDTMRALQPIVTRFQQDQDTLRSPSFTPQPIQVALNPKPFREMQVGEEGPALAVIRSDGEIIKGKGTLSIAAVLDHHDRFGTLAALGPTTPFVERDLLDEIRDRVEELDEEEIKRGAQDRLWARLSTPQVDLPLADQYSRVELDLTFKLQHDLKDQNGTTLVPAGTAFNPMDQMPFTRTMVVFDPSRPEEIERIDHYLSHRKPSLSNVRLIATHFATAANPKARDAQQEIEAHFKVPVFLLDRAVLNRFGIQQSPTVVTGNNVAKRMVVETLGPKAP